MAQSLIERDGAVVVDAGKLESEIQRQKQLEEKKRLEEKARLERLERS